jgi:hypothetical protein
MRWVVGGAELCSGLACVPWIRAAVDDRLVVADLDGDGVGEVVRGNWSPSDARGEVVAFHVVSGRFEPAWTLTGAPGERLGDRVELLGDVDGDERLELAVIAAGGGRPTPAPRAVEPRPLPPRLVVISAIAAGTVKRTDVVTLTGWSNEVALATGDVDGDGAIDVAISGIGLGGEPTVEVRRGGAGAVAAAPTWTYPIAPGRNAFVLIDDDGDGDADLLWCDPSQRERTVIRWSGGRGGLDASASVTRSDPASRDQSWFGTRIVVGAFTRAGAPELAVTSHGARRAYVYELASTTPDRTIDVAAFPLAGQQAAAIDLDADGTDALVFIEPPTIVVFPGARADQPALHATAP